MIFTCKGKGGGGELVSEKKNASKVFIINMEPLDQAIMKNAKITLDPEVARGSKWEKLVLKLSMVFFFACIIFAIHVALISVSEAFDFPAALWRLFPNTDPELVRTIAFLAICYCTAMVDKIYRFFKLMHQSLKEKQKSKDKEIVDVEELDRLIKRVDDYIAERDRVCNKISMETFSISPMDEKNMGFCNMINNIEDQIIMGQLNPSRF